MKMQKKEEKITEQGMYKAEATKKLNEHLLTRKVEDIRSTMAQ